MFVKYLRKTVLTIHKNVLALHIILCIDGNYECLKKLIEEENIPLDNYNKQFKTTLHLCMSI
jgi:hypothetical protein